MRLDHVQNNLKRAKNRGWSWAKTLKLSLKRNNSQVLQALIELTLQGNTLPQCCEVLGIPYYAMVKHLRTDSETKLLIKRARKHRAVVKREEMLQSICI